MRSAVRETGTYIILITMVIIFVASETMRRAETAEYYATLQETTAELDEFLDGWKPYRPAILRAELKLKEDAATGSVPPFTCQAVFIRHNFVVPTK